MFTDGLEHDIDYFINQFSPAEVTAENFETEKSKGLYYFTGNLLIGQDTEQLEYFYYSDDSFTQTYDHETIPVVRDGISTASVQEYYARSESATTAPSTWYTTPPASTGKNKYLWNYEVTTMSDGSQNVTEPQVISENGKGIKSITEYYGVSSSYSEYPTSWSTDPQPVSTNSRYLWNYELVTYTDDSTTQTTPAIIGTYADKGEKGDKGDKGDTGASGTPAPRYLGISASAVTATVTGDYYLNSTTQTLYAWSGSEWVALDATDSRWATAMGDALNYAKSTGVVMTAAVAWIGNLVVGNVLADQLSANKATFKDVTVTGTINATAGTFTGRQDVKGIFRNAGFNIRDSSIDVHSDDSVAFYFRKVNHTQLMQTVTSRAERCNDYPSLSYNTYFIEQHGIASFTINNAKTITIKTEYMELIVENGKVATDVCDLWGYDDSLNVYSARFETNEIHLYLITPDSNGQLVNGLGTKIEGHYTELSSVSSFSAIIM